MQNCELCGPLREKAFWKNSWFYAIDASTDEFPCFIRIVCTRHVAEMSELTKAERTYLWALRSIWQHGATPALASNRSLERRPIFS